MFMLRCLSMPFLLDQTGGDAPAGGGAPAPIVAPAPAPAAPQPAPAPAPVPAAPPAAAATTPTSAERDPEWLNQRLAKAKTSGRNDVLKELGVSSLDDVKAAINARQAQIDAEKTSAQKASELEGSLASVKAQNAALLASVTAFATAQMGALTEAQKAAVVAIAGDDPSRQVTTIEALRPTWAAQAAPTVTPATAPAAPTTAPAPSPAPTDTAPAPSAPSPTNAVSQPNHKAVYAELRKTNPVVAANYAFVHGVHDT